MPSLTLFNRRWRIGSDDFVFPGCFEAFVRSGWLVLTICLISKHLNDATDESASCKEGKLLILMYLIGVIIMLTLTIIASVVLVIHSAQGTIMNTGPRKLVPSILTLRVVLGIVEVGWNILGTVWLYSDQVKCEQGSALWFLLEALVVYTWVALPVLAITALVLFEPMMRPENEDSTLNHFRSSYILDRSNSGIGSHYIQLWERRCRFLCCTFSKDENSSEAFRNVADVFASLFEESDLVASDIAAALVLLRLTRKLEENHEEEKMQKINLHFNKVTTRNELIDEKPPPEWMNVRTAHHFMKFAMASYGWPWYVYGRAISAAFSLRNYIKCCGCFRQANDFERKDNCCRCNIAALRVITELPEENIIHISFHNKIYECPFFVAIDDVTQNVVLSIRGTLSLHDAITDLNAQSTLLSCEGLPDGCRAHKGVVNATLYVRNALEETGALQKAFSMRPDYGLVITGHSLGAGAAVVLASMLRPHYTNVKCVAFSPPGGLCTMQMSKATQDFVFSVVVGDDLVPRLSINAMHDLHKRIIGVLNNCKKPKFRVLAKGCWYMLFGISKASLISSTTSQDQLLPTSDGGPQGYLSSSIVDEESIQDIRVMFSEAPLRPIPRHTETLLFPPGHILYLKPNLTANEGDAQWDCVWKDCTDFDKILISPNMLRHHLPQIVLAALHSVIDQQIS